MKSVAEAFNHLNFPLQEIKSATNSFHDSNLIGSGGFGLVYKGQLSSNESTPMAAAFKRLDRKYGQGDVEFWKEILMLSQYTHENLISLLGFCQEGEENILVYEYASKGSLDRHLADTSLSWIQRLNICIGAARGLIYLHDPAGTHQRVLHRDIKSANILLDDNWNAKLSDFGLSKIGPANQPYSFLISNAVGTYAYCDPMYAQSGLLTKESDVYSFGVVLFEVVCGCLCYEYSEGKFRQIFVRSWLKSYEEKKLHEFVCKHLLEQKESDSLNTFLAIAYRSLRSDPKQRPTMVEVLEELELALDSQELHEGRNKPINYEEMIKAVISPVSYKDNEELQSLLLKGFFINDGKTWLQINNKGETIVRVGAECLVQSNERYPESHRIWNTIIAQARTRFLTPHITYAVYLVFKHFVIFPEDILHATIRYKLDTEENSWISYFAKKREDGCYMAELYQFTSYKRSIDLTIMFENDKRIFRKALGIEFQPVDNVKHEDMKDGNRVDFQPVSDSDAYWAKKLPSNYENIIMRSDNVRYTTRKELYFLLRKGILINKGKVIMGWFPTDLTSLFSKKSMWFSLDENGKNCLMLPATTVIKADVITIKSVPESRFNEAVEISMRTSKLSFVFKFESDMLSPRTNYGIYLVYKLTKDQSLLQVPKMVFSEGIYYLVSPQTPVIRKKDDQCLHKPLNMLNIEWLPQLRKDGWMEVQLQKGDLSTFVDMSTDFQQYGNQNLGGLLVQGFEFRPVESKCKSESESESV